MRPTQSPVGSPPARSPLVSYSSCFAAPPLSLAAITVISRLLPPPSSIQATRPPPTASSLTPSPEQPRSPGFTRIDLLPEAVQTTIRPQPCLTLVATAARLPS